MRYKLLNITLLLGLLFAACSRENGIEPVLDDRPITISFSVDDFVRGAGFKGNEADGKALRATDDGSTSEQEVNNLYLFLFDNTGANPVKYYIDAATFPGGTWVNTSVKKITLNMTQAEAGERQVHIIANCADLKTQLDGVTTVAGLQTVYRNTTQPWSTNINTPILMAGSSTHNFITQGYQLNSVRLIRTIAKIELNLTLTSGFQVLPTIDSEDNLAEYKYRYVDFDTRTYGEKPGTKPVNPASSSADAWPNTGSWMPWGASLNGSSSPDAGTSYILNGEGKVTGLKLITYLNESDEAVAAVEIELPRVDPGPLPPPEFGPELYRLPLPEKIERNNWYRYDIEI